MIEFPDYRQCFEAKRLLLNMGIISIPPLPNIDFTKTERIEHTNYVPDEEAIKLRERMEINFIEVGPEDLHFVAGGFIEVKGNLCCIYIKDQHGYEPNKYHVQCCPTISRALRESTLGTRFIATSRCDGLFPVIARDSFEEKLVKLELCGHCANSMGVSKSSFNLKEVFSKYQKPVPMKKVITVTEFSKSYIPTNYEREIKYKEYVGYKCQLCGVNCHNNQDCLYLYHLDGNQKNYSHENLRVLCSDCQSKMAHGIQSNISDKNKRVQNLRKEQNIKIVKS